jgi:hypothetical protein
MNNTLQSVPASDMAQCIEECSFKRFGKRTPDKVMP